MAKAKTLENTNNYWYEMPVLPTQRITDEEKKMVVAKISRKYGVPANKIRFTTKKIYVDGTDCQDNALNAEMINNIRDPKFQQELFKEYMERTMKKNTYDIYQRTLKKVLVK